jgi:hypothetical protein
MGIFWFGSYDACLVGREKREERWEKKGEGRRGGFMWSMNEGGW